MLKCLLSVYCQADFILDSGDMKINRTKFLPPRIRYFGNEKGHEANEDITCDVSNREEYDIELGHLLP